MSHVVPNVVPITSNGDGAKFYSNPKTWTINSVERLIQNEQITTDDGIVSNGLNEEYGLQYSHYMLLEN